MIRGIPASIPDPKVTAAGNLRIMCWAWCILASLAGLSEISLWPQTANITSVFLAWTSCILTGVIVLRPAVASVFPWSSLVILMFCLTTCWLPLIMMLLQEEPFTAHLEVPTQTFTHLLLCQIVLLLMQGLYRYNSGLRNVQTHVRDTVLRPLGIFADLSPTCIYAFGTVGLLASIYVSVYLPDHNDGAPDAAGSVVAKSIQGLSSFIYAPVVLLFGSHGRQAATRRNVLLAAYFLTLSLVALAINNRSMLFTVIATGSCIFVLLLMVGTIKMNLVRTLFVGAVVLAFMVTVGADISIAMRVTRGDRNKLSPEELMLNTCRLLIADRGRLGKLRSMIAGGDDSSEAWYIKSPTFARLISTQFLDRALSVSYELNEKEIEEVRQRERDLVFTALPDPLLRLFGSSVDKSYVASFSMGDLLLYMSGRRGAFDIGYLSTGGFIGDGYAAYGWGYLVPFGLFSFALFGFADSLYHCSTGVGPAQADFARGFAFVGLINAFELATIPIDSIGGLMAFAIRTPFQWLLLYGMLFWGLRFVQRVFNRDAYPFFTIGQT